jgi:hypothetical protein
MKTQTSTSTEQAKAPAAASVKSGGVQTATGFLPYGTHKGKIELISMSLGDQPAFYVRVKADNGASVTHITRLHNDTSARIGLGEIRQALPQELAGKNDEDLMTELISNTSEFIGREVEFSVAAQKDPRTGLTMRSKKGQDYFNVRLHNAIHDIKDADKARSLVKEALSKRVAGVTTVVDASAFGE